MVVGKEWGGVWRFREAQKGVAMCGTVNKCVEKCRKVYVG